MVRSVDRQTGNWQNERMSKEFDDFQREMLNEAAAIHNEMVFKRSLTVRHHMARDGAPIEFSVCPMNLSTVSG